MILKIEFFRIKRLWVVRAHFVKFNRLHRRVVALAYGKQDALNKAVVLWMQNPNKYKLG